jgi:hypothetical protein
VMRAFLLASLCAVALPAYAHDELDGFLFGPDPTQATHEQDARIREALTERDWIVHSNLHPKKRRYDNLTAPQRRQWRARAHEMARLYWLRGAMNDPLRAFEVLEGPHIFQPDIERDPCGQEPLPCPTVSESDLCDVTKEDVAAAPFYSGTSPGERLTPVSNAEHLTFQESIKYPHVGLGQQRIGFAETNEDLVRDRVHRHFKWGKHKDAKLWREKTLNLVERLMKRKASVKSLMSVVPRLQKHTENLVENVAGDRTPFARKNQLFRTALASNGTDAQIEEALELVIQGEIQAAKLARGDLAPSDRPGRNQMAGMALVIAGAAAGYAESPDHITLMRLGAVGVMGKRGGAR